MDIPIFGFSPFSTTGIRSWVVHVSQNVFMLTLLSVIKMHLRVIFLWVIFLIVLCIVIIHKCSFDSFSIETVAIIAILKRYSYSERLRVSVWCLFSRTLWAEKNYYPMADLRAKLCKLRYIGTCRKMFSIGFGDNTDLLSWNVVNNQFGQLTTRVSYQRGIRRPFKYTGNHTYWGLKNNWGMQSKNDLQNLWGNTVSFILC